MNRCGDCKWFKDRGCPAIQFKFNEKVGEDSIACHIFEKKDSQIIAIEYSRDGIAIPDYSVNSFVSNIMECVSKKCEFTISISTEAPIHAIRFAIASGLIPHNRIVFRYNNTQIHVNKYGAIEDWPSGFADMGATLSENILRSAMKQRRMERQND